MAAKNKALQEVEQIKRVKSSRQKVGLPPMHIHDLRYSAATILLAMGVNIRVVQEILGHSNISTILGIYGHVLPGMQEEAMKKWGKILGEQQQ